MAPIYPVHKHDLETGAYLDANGKATTDPGEYIYDYEGTRLSNNGRDAIAETEFNQRELVRVNQTGHTYLTLTPVEGLNLTANYSINNIDYRRKVYENPYVGDGTAGPGRLNQMSTRTLTQTFNQLITYSKSIGNHNFDVLLGHENYSYKYEYLYGMKTQETVSGMYEFGNFVNISSLSSYTNTYKKEGYFGRINYDYAHKYYASLSYRHDGSSRFAKENRWGNFWSFGAGWRISEEAFMKDVKWVNNLKLRASYGETGNDNILDSDGDPDYYPYQTLYGLGYKNGSEAGAYFTVIANPSLKWETQISTDIALEFGLFDRLTGTIEYFKKDSKDLLFDVSQPASVGVTSIIQNIGKVTNSGVEIELDYNAFKNKDWSVSVGANATFVKNKIKNLPATMKENGYISGSKKWLEGKSIYEFWLRQWHGVDPQTGDGLYVADVSKCGGSNKKACGGRKKAAFGTWTNDITNALIGTVGNVVGNAIAGSGGYTPTSKLLNYKTNTYKTYKPAELEVYDDVADKFNVRKTGENTAKYANAQNNNVAAMNTLGQNPTAAITAVSQIQSPRYTCGGGKKVRKRKR